MSSPLKVRIRAVLKTAGCLQSGAETLGDDSDLHAAGLTSHATVSLMLALEEAFDVEFPTGFCGAGRFPASTRLPRHLPRSVCETRRHDPVARRGPRGWS